MRLPEANQRKKLSFHSKQSLESNHEMQRYNKHGLHSSLRRWQITHLKHLLERHFLAVVVCHHLVGVVFECLLDKTQ